MSIKRLAVAALFTAAITGIAPAAAWASGGEPSVKGQVSVTSGPASGELLPDLGMAQLTTIYIDTTTMPGHRLLRYTATLVNVGAGPLELNGTRPDTSTTDMTVTQRIYNSAGGYVDMASPLVMYYAGDGHNHWHTKDIEGGVLTRLSNGHPVGTLAKEGFCFSDGGKHDLALPGAPQSAVYVVPPSCSPGNPAALSTGMGLSVGWSDTYVASVVLQWIDITGLPNGRYMLTATANPNDQAIESDYSNNSTWAKLQITGNTVKVLQTSPGL
ncbi:MAG: hypothetical protein C5B60_05945 [Chloroflexi bacterium]|nr:MAG: hypothetical protein C5B60_05945 [Chloroflexota bacterium]